MEANERGESLIVFTITYYMKIILQNNVSAFKIFMNEINVSLSLSFLKLCIVLFLFSVFHIDNFFNVKLLISSFTFQT